MKISGSKRCKQENLKEMGDISSGMASAVIQHYLKEILQSYLHSNIQVRQLALKVIQLILQQGLVHPVQVRDLFQSSNLNYNFIFFSIVFRLFRILFA